MTVEPKAAKGRSHARPPRRMSAAGRAVCAAHAELLKAAYAYAQKPTHAGHDRLAEAALEWAARVQA